MGLEIEELYLGPASGEHTHVLELSGAFTKRLTDPAWIIQIENFYIENLPLQAIKNAIIMGRLTWESIPENKRPYKDRFNIVLTRRMPEDIPGAHLVCPSLESAMESLQSPPLTDKIESVFVFGGTRVYEEAMKSSLCETLYVTEVLAEFEADTFFPPIDTTIYHLINDPSDPLVPSGELEENTVKFKFSVYKRELPGGDQ